MEEARGNGTMMSRDETRDVPRSHAAKALAKCLEFLDTAGASLQSKRWNAAGLNAIHAGIAAADAALIAATGTRSIARDHNVVIALLEAQPMTHFSASQRRQLVGLLKLKNQVAYDQRLLTEIEARQLVDHAARLAKWATLIVEDGTPA